MAVKPKSSSPGVTSADVAALAGVHRSSVSAVLNGARTNTGVSQATRERILKIAAELNYSPDTHAQRLKGGRDQKTLALLVFGMDFDVTARKSVALQEGLAQKGFNVPLYVPQNSSAQGHAAFVAQLRRQRPGAIICYTRGLQSEAFGELEQYQAEGGHLILFDDPASISCDQVIFDREDNTYQAARYLLELGHRNIGFWISQKLEGSRYDGFRRALAEFGVQENPEWIMSGGHFFHNEQNGAELAQRILAMKERPTAVCIVNDHTAQACVAGLQRAGVRVPEGISIVGHDDLPIARYGTVQLTTVSHPIEQITEHVMRMLLERIEGHYEGEPRSVTVRGSLFVRESTARRNV